MAVFHWTTQDYIYVTAECVVGVLTVIGNALVLLAIARTRSLQTITNCFIGSLAAADLLVGIIMPPTVILPYLGLPRDFLGCVMINTVVVLITNISILSLLGVALERYLAISDPYRYHRVMSVRRALEVVAVTWVVAILIGLIPTMGWHLEEEGFDTCSFTNVIDMRFMVYLIFFGVTLPPLLFMLIIYLYIFHIIRKQQRAVAHLTVLSRENERSVRTQKREVRGAKGLAYVIVLFAACWLPMHIMNSITLFAPDSSAPLQWLLVAIVLGHANSFVNPFLYAFSNSRFKKAMLKILFCGRCQSCYTTETDDLDSRFTGQDYSTRFNNSRKVWTTSNSRHFLSSDSGTLRQYEPSVSFNSGSGVLNKAFSVDERKTQKSTFKFCRQSETVMSKVMYVNGQEIRDCGHNRNHPNGRSTKDRQVLVVSAGDSTSPLSLASGSDCRVWVTQSSLSPPVGTKDSPVHSSSTKSLQRPQVSDERCNLDQQFFTKAHSLSPNNNEEVINIHNTDCANIDRQDCKLVSTEPGSGNVPRQDIQLMSTKPDCAIVVRQDSKLVSTEPGSGNVPRQDIQLMSTKPDCAIVVRQDSKLVSKNPDCALIERQDKNLVSTQLLSIRL